MTGQLPRQPVLVSPQPTSPAPAAPTPASAPHPQPILLRRWQGTDAAALVEIFGASTDLATQYPFPVTDPESAGECLDKMLGWDQNRRNFAIVVDGKAVGNIGLTAIERRHYTGWMSYFSSCTVRGRGLVTRSAIAVANWGLGELGLFRLELGHRVNNPVSGAIAVATGFVLEGRERQKLLYGNERFDILSYGRLVTDPAPVVSGVTLEANELNADNTGAGDTGPGAD